MLEIKDSDGVIKIKDVFSLDDKLKGIVFDTKYGKGLIENNNGYEINIETNGWTVRAKINHDKFNLTFRSLFDALGEGVRTAVYLIMDRTNNYVTQLTPFEDLIPNTVDLNGVEFNGRTQRLVLKKEDVIIGYYKRPCYETKIRINYPRFEKIIDYKKALWNLRLMINYYLRNVLFKE